MLDIIQLGEEVLREKCKEVTKFDDSLRILTEAMIEAMDEADGVGLAGPQVGVPERLFVAHVPQMEPMVFINPSIIETSLETCPYEEGCLSIPGFFHEVVRPERVTVQAQDVKGKAFTIQATGLLARIIQHENDHLDGMLFIDHLSEREREKIVRAFERRSKTAKVFKRKHKRER